MNAPPIPDPPTPSELDHAITRAQKALFEAVSGDPPQWEGYASLEPICTAQVLIVRAWVGEPSPNAASLARGLLAQQQSDGSFLPYPHAARGDVVDEVCATATVWAALNVVPGVPESAAAIERARAFVEQNGGAAKVVDGLAQLNFAPVFAAMGGSLDPALLPDVSGALALLPSMIRDALGTRLTGYVMEAVMMVAAVVAHLKDKGGLLRWIEDHRALELVRAFQNEPGDWDGETTQTTLMLAFYHAAGVSHDDDHFTKAVRWLGAMEMVTADGGPPTQVSEFGSAVWCTSFALRALLDSGVSRRHDLVASTLHWLVGCQVLDVDQARVDNLHAGAPRRGGWAFQRSNQTMPDCDDTGVALMALGRALDARGAGDDHLDPAQADEIQAAITKGDAWLRGMQDPCGGWGAFAWGFKEKPRGAIMQAPPNLGFHMGSMIGKVLDPPWFVQDNATEDVTGRVLMGLGGIGNTKDDPAVAKAIAFLQRQQCKNAKGEGYGWWGRWVVNYLAATSFVLQGLAEVGEDMKAPYVQQAVAWLLERQNPDGGWGEGVESYADPSRAGQGQSIPPLTGLVVAALVAAGEAESPAVLRGVRFLLDQQRPDGKWDNDRWLHVYLPPSLFYTLPVEHLCHPLLALGRYAHARGALAARRPDGDPAAQTQALEERTQHAVARAEEALWRARLEDGAWRSHRDDTPGSGEARATALAIRALVQGGVGGGDPRLAPSIAFLLRGQSDVLRAAEDGGSLPAPHTGGWGPANGDADDTAAAMTALALALQRGLHGAAPDDLAYLARSGLYRADDWIVGAVDAKIGGWGAGAGPTAETTAHVLCALGALGYGFRSAVVKLAFAFLETQSATSEVPATASMLLGLAAIDAEFGHSWVAALIRRLLDRQRDDGGWGEASVTGLAITALLALADRTIPDVDAGLLEDAAKKGVAYLCASQREDGTWPGDGLSSTTSPLEALGVHLRRLRGLPAIEAKDLATHDMPAQTGARPSATAWPDALLDRARRWGDPAADTLIATIYRDARKLDARVDNVDRIFGLVMQNSDPQKLREELGASPDAITEGVEAFFAQTLPAGWPSPEDLAVAERLFARCSVAVVFALFLSSLPQCYAGANGAHVLYRSLNMKHVAARRIFRVGEFIFDVMGPGAFAPGGRAVPAILKVRLLHGALRHLAQRNFWEDAWGLPVNQEDLAATLLTFSSVVVDGLRALGVAVSDAEADAWQRAWNGVGHLLGVHEAFLPEGYAAAGRLMDRIRDRQWASSIEGTELTRALVEVLLRLNFFRLGGHLWPAAAIRRIAGDRCADKLQLAKPDALGEAYADLDHALCEWLSGSTGPLLTHLAQPLSGAAMQELLAFELRNIKMTQFALPRYLAR